MSSNLVKVQYTYVLPEEKRIIDNNELLAKRLEAYSMQRQSLAETEKSGESQEGFVSGLDVLQLGVLEEAAETENEGNMAEPVLPTPEELVQKAMDEVAEIKREASRQLDEERIRVLEEARRTGYEEGRKKAEQEYLEKEEARERQMQEMEQNYQKQIDELEPLFIETLTGIYEKIFHVELSKYRDILVYLIGTTIRKTEGCREFVVHVSAEDYPYVNMQKKQLQDMVGLPGGIVEVTEDLSLNRNECQIETQNGIFDCGLGTELEELSGKLKLLSYERPE